MGLLEKWTGDTNKVANVYFVLKNIDDSNNADIVLADDTESNTLPETGPITTILQTVKNNLKYLFANKEDKSNKKTSITDSDTEYPTTKAVKTQLDLKASTTQLDAKVSKAITDADKAKFIKGDGTFATPPDNDTVYNHSTDHPTTAGNIHLPAGGASGNIVEWSSAGTDAWANKLSSILNSLRGIGSTANYKCIGCVSECTSCGGGCLTANCVNGCKGCNGCKTCNGSSGSCNCGDCEGCGGCSGGCNGGCETACGGSCSSACRSIAS
ncbi:MAG: hypothetical protein LBK93_01120 [Rickettsiales bacterium]|jgi:hypothetical protein|nr:hypothetical protein [Rickettsiales bacterium]